MNKRTKRRTYVAVTLALLFTLSVMAGCWTSARTNVERLLSKAGLSPLPASATNVAYYQWNGLFTGETYGKFELDANDMGRFISNSPALQAINPEVYHTNHQHILYSK